MVLSPTMSAFTNTTYTSAAPSTPHTSLSGASAPCASPEIRPTTMPLSSVAPAEAHDPPDGDFRFAVKGASLLCSALVAFWLLGSAMDDALAFYIVVYALLRVYGGTRTGDHQFQHRGPPIVSKALIFLLQRRWCRGSRSSMPFLRPHRSPPPYNAI